MKYLAIIALLTGSAYSHLASAQSDYAIEWSIPSSVGPNKYTTMHLDINEGTRFLTANGMLIAGDLGTPATGTCFFVQSGNIHCSLSVSAATYTVDILPSLNGTITKIDSVTGNNGESALLQFVEIK